MKFKIGQVVAFKESHPHWRPAGKYHYISGAAQSPFDTSEIYSLDGELIIPDQGDFIGPYFSAKYLRPLTAREAGR